MNFTSEDLLLLEHSVSNLLKASGNTLFQEWQHEQQVSFKEYNEPVTELDIKIEKNLRLELTKLLPGTGFIVEEGENNEFEEYNWVIDSIDQTKNFIGQIPLFYTQVALVRKNTPILGVIYNPISDQLFSASQGNGTKLNNCRISKKVKNTLKESLVDIEFGGNNNGVDWKISVVGELAKIAYRIRLTGGAFFPYLATNGIDAFVELNEKTKITDRMPRIIIARELGLLFEPFELKNHKIFIAGSKNVFKEIRDIIFTSNI